MPAWERYHLYTTKDIWSELREALTTDPDADRQHNEDMAALKNEARTAAQNRDLCADVADKPLRGDDRPPLVDLEPVAAPDPDSVKPVEDAPPTAPVNNRTPAEIMGEMPEPLRRAKPSFDPEALLELIDRGIDPDEAMERLQEQADRWS
jgi:hypothetical protein